MESKSIEKLTRAESASYVEELVPGIVERLVLEYEQSDSSRLYVSLSSRYLSNVYATVLVRDQLRKRGYGDKIDVVPYEQNGHSSLSINLDDLVN